MPAIRTDPSEATPPSGPTILLAAVGFGLVTGYLELLQHGLRKYGRALFIFQGGDILWMAPLANALLFLVVGVVLVVVLSRHPARRWNLSLGIFFFGAASAFLFHVPRVHRMALLLLAVGVAVQGTRLVRKRLPAFPRLVRRATPWLMLGTLGLALGVQGRRILGERHAMRSLPAVAGRAPNVLLIVLDTVRALSLSLYGYERPTTPHLSRWAARGITFARALSTSPWTLPTHASLFTGRLPHELSTDWFDPLDDTYPTLAEALRNRGYATAGFVANTAYCTRETGLSRGYIRYEDHPINMGQLASSSILINHLLDNGVARRVFKLQNLAGRKNAPDINRAFLSWLDARDERPFFAFLNYYDAHTPYLPPQEFADRFRTPGIPLHPDLARHGTPGETWDPDEVQGANDAYDGAIAFLDYHVDQLLQALEQRGLLENTLIILTSDHGEEFNEHGLIHHGNSLFLPSVHVPLVLWTPGSRGPTGQVVEAPVSLRDVPATVLDLVDIPEPRFPGASLARFWQSGPVSPDTVVAELEYAPLQPAWYPASKGDLASAVFQGLRYIRLADGTESLFDFDHDPGERNDLASDPERSADLEQFRRIFGALGIPLGAGDPLKGTE